LEQEINAHDQTVLCRTENYANYHSGLNGLLRGKKLLGLLKQLSGEDMLLFKEKINYKLAGSGKPSLLRTLMETLLIRDKADLLHISTLPPIPTSRR
jgi:hypothetical protein